MKRNLFFLLIFTFLLTPFAQAQQTKNTSATDQQVEVPKTKRVAKRKPVEAKEEALETPTLAERLNEQRLAIRRGEEREQSQPYLIEEVSVNGIYKSVEGYGAFLKASNGRLFFAYKGMNFYDGQVLQIDPDQVIFQQNLAKGKTKQVIKAYDPSALRSTTVEKDKDKKEEPKKKKVQKDDDGEDVGTKDE